MELYEFVKCKSFFDHVSELIDDDSNGQISLQEWLSFFNEDGEWYCTITQCCTALKHVNISHYIFLCNFETYVSSRFVVYSSLLLSSPPLSLPLDSSATPTSGLGSSSTSSSGSISISAAQPSKRSVPPVLRKPLNLRKKFLYVLF